MCGWITNWTICNRLVRASTPPRWIFAESSRVLQNVSRLAWTPHQLPPTQFG